MYQARETEGNLFLLQIVVHQASNSEYMNPSDGLHILPSI